MEPPRTRTFTTANAATTTINLANRFLIPLLNSRAGGLLGHRLAVVEYAGRRTGQDHELVAMYVAEGHTVRFTVGRAKQKTWWRNFETPHPLRLRLAGVVHDASARVVLDGDRVSVVAELIPRGDPGGRAASVDAAAHA